MAFLDYNGLKRFFERCDNLYMRKTPTDWRDIATAVRKGEGATFFPVGSQITLKHSVYGDVVMDVVSHDTVKKYGDENAHTMCLMSHDCLLTLQWDAAEAMYYASSGLAAGTYNFTVNSAYGNWNAGTYQFTITQNVPSKGQLCISGSNNTELTALNVQSYASTSSTSAIESVAITSGTSGTTLGTLGVELNHIQRICNGSNNYKESAVRQFLNSTETIGNVWTAQTGYDRPPTWATTTAGFLNGCDENFVAAVTSASVKCITNDVYEAPASVGGTTVIKTQYEEEDKIFIPSATEVGISGAVDGSAVFQYYENAGDADRIKTRSGSAVAWWTRTPNSGETFRAYDIARNGGSDASSVIYSLNIAPTCIIA